MKITNTHLGLLAAALLLVPAAARAQDDYANSEWIPPNVMGRTSFAVEEFVPNRVKVEAQAEEGRFSKQRPLHVTVRAEEMFGQPIAHRPVSGTVSWNSSAFRPAKWESFTFGDSEVRFSEHEAALPEETLDENGETSVVITPPARAYPRALQARVQVVVTDGGRAVVRHLTRTYDPVDYYVGIRSASSTYASPGEPMQFELVAVQPDENIRVVDTTLTGTISQIHWNSNLVRSGYSYNFQTRRELKPVKDVEARLVDGRATLSWEPSVVGNYLIRLHDTASSASVSHEFYVSSRDWSNQPWSLEKPEEAELVLDKPSYSVGDEARLIIKAPFPGTVLLTLEQDKVLSSTVITLTENTVEVPITVTEDMLPNVYAVASVIRPVQSAAQWLPHRAIGTVNLPVRAPSRDLNIAISAPEEVRPETALTVTVQVSDQSTSAPVSGDLLVWAVDEGVLSLTDFKTPNPTKYFYSPRSLMVETADFFSSLVPDLITAAVAASATGGGDMEDQRLTPVPSERVKPVVLWQGPVRTDASGRAEFSWNVPQYMGRLRVMAMAADGQRFGSADRDVFVRSPLMVKEYAPRFAAPGDEFTVGMTVYNNTDAPVQPVVNASAQPPLHLDPAEEQQLPAIAARSQATVYRTARVDADHIGQAPITFESRAGEEHFATSLTLPIRPASPYISLAQTDSVKEGESKTLQLPGNDFLPSSTTATLVVGGSPNLALAGALRYNVTYPYGCSEQVVSQLFPLLYLQDLAALAEPETYDDNGLRQVVNQGIDRVFSMQAVSGGLAMWTGSYETWDWASIYAAHFLVEARRAGYRPHPVYLDALLKYVQYITDRSMKESSTNELTQHAYAIYVLLRAERPAHQRLEQLYEVRDRLNAEGRALLAAGYLAAGQTNDARTLLESAPALAEVDGDKVKRSTGNTLASPIRETAIMLMAWTDLGATSTEATGLATRLLSLQKNGRWGSTQENAFAMVALGHYANRIAEQPRASGTVKIGGQTHSFSADEPLRLSAAELAGAKVEVTVDSGTAYVSSVVEGVPIAPPNEPVSQGLSVERRYLDREGNALPAGPLKEGQLVLVEIEVKNSRNLDNVVIQDLLPAGMEVENARLSTSEDVEGADDVYGVIVKQLDIRDDRILVFADLTRTKDGKQTYRYLARAVTPGQFIHPPVQVEVMYDPAIQARNAPGNLRIEPRSAP